MGKAYGPGNDPRNNSNNAGNRFHFPELGPDGTCGKLVHPHFNSGSRGRCGQDRNGDRHLFYACRAEPGCRAQMYSLEARELHEQTHEREK
jgi:hypothetical protein